MRTETGTARAACGLLIAAALLLGGCGQTPRAPNAAAARLTAEAAEIAGCSARFVATVAHPFLAEFEREVTLTCHGKSSTLKLQRDGGGMGRVELVQLVSGKLVVTDAFQLTTLSATDAGVVSLGFHEGKFDSYDTPCVRTPVFHRADGTFLGAFDYCDHRWQFLRP